MNELFILRHGNRIDHSDEISDFVSYDPCLSQKGVKGSIAVSREILNRRQNEAIDEIIVHSSPYYRCLETSANILNHLDVSVRKTIRIDKNLSEWLHPNIKNIPPLQQGNHLINKNLHLSPYIDTMWNSELFGDFNSINLSYNEFKANIKSYLERFTEFYNGQSNKLIVIVTHGIVVNLLISRFLEKNIFDEIPETTLNYIVNTGTNWSLEYDCLDLLEPEGDYILDLNKNIDYYNTNFNADWMGKTRENQLINQMREIDLNDPHFLNLKESTPQSQPQDEDHDMSPPPFSIQDLKESFPLINSKGDPMTKKYYALVEKIDLYGEEHEEVSWFGSNRL